MIDVNGIKFSYGTGDVLKDISFRVHEGRVVSILGVNGSGKSTLLKTINGILRPRQGTVHVDGRETKAMSREEIARSMGYMPQKSQATPCTVFEAVLLGRTPHISWYISPHDIAKTQEIVELMGLGGYSHRCTTQLSGGELQRVIIARALAQEPRVLLLDEPVNHLDIRSQMNVMTLIRNITQSFGIATIVVMHDLNTALRFSDEFILMKEGSLFAAGNRDIMTAATISEAYGLRVALSEVQGIPVVVPYTDHDEGRHWSAKELPPLEQNPRETGEYYQGEARTTGGTLRWIRTEP
ncbi:MAG: ABC transporter ATP-binding protein [Geobacter sp.]|nr:MAG: ABC transporter ATP-binding protein [Geobacter sp.]